MHFPGNFTSILKIMFLTQLPRFLSAYWKKQCNIHKRTHVCWFPVNSVGLQRKINEEISEEAALQA